MAHHSKYTGLQIDVILDSVAKKQNEIEDLASIRAGAAKGATALQSYTEKYTGTVTGIKINGVVKSGSGVIDLGTISTTETDPIFSASPAASITEAKKVEWDNKVDKVSGKQLSTEDFTTALKTKLEGLSNYDDTELSNAIETLRGDFDEIVSGDTTTAIKTFNEVIAFLDGLTDTQDLDSIIASIEQQIAGKMDTLISGTNIKTINGESILGSGDLTIEGGAKVCELDLTDRGENGSITEEEWNILKDVDTLKIKSDVGSFLVHKTSPGMLLMGGEDIRLFSSLEMTGFGGEENRPIFSAQTFVFMGPTYNSPLSYSIFVTDTPTKTSQLENDSNFVTSEDVAAVALSGSYNDLTNKPTIPSAVTESTVSGWGFTKNAGTITGVKINGTTKSPTSGVVDLGTVITDVSNLATKDEVILKDVTGELVTTHTQALYGGSSVYALPDQANGDEDDVLLSQRSLKTVNGQSIVGRGDITISGGGSYDDSEIREAISQLSALTDDFNSDIANLYDVKQDTLESGTNIKTINGESIVGSGDIEISGGGAGVYITPFTVEQFCTSWVELTEEQRNDLSNAASQKKIIGIRSGHDDTSGYIIASYSYHYTDEELWSMELSFVWNNAFYSRCFYSYDEINTMHRLGITPFTPIFSFVNVENGVAVVSDDTNYTDNRVFWVVGECTELYIYLDPSDIGKTVRFFTGESCTLEMDSAYWANGEAPTIEPYTHYELSLVANTGYAFNAVLTPFKPVE